MFRSLCKSLFRNRVLNGGNSKHLILCSHFTSQFHIRVRSISSSSSSSFIVSYLMNSFGLTEKQALTASKRHNFKTTSNADSVLNFFQDYGFTKSDISKIIRKRSILLICNPHKTLKPKLDYFNSKDISRVDVVKVLSTNPEILTRSLEDSIIPFFDFIKNIVGNDRYVFSVFERLRNSADLNKKVKLNLQLLRDEGVMESNIVKHIIRQPRSLTVSTTKFKEILQEIKGMGFDPYKTSFVCALKAIMGMNKSNWEMKLNAYRKWGWSENEMLNAFKVYPTCMMFSTEKISRILNYFVNQMGYNASFVAKNPIFLGFSLEKRIIPRCNAYQILVSKGLIKDPIPITKLLRMSEESFLEKFVIKYEKEAPELLKESVRT